MRKTLILLSLLFSTFIHSQEYNSIDYINFEKANAAFAKLEKLNYSEIESISYRLSGTWHLLGHSSLPKERRAIPIWNSLTYSHGEEYKLISTIENNKQTLKQIEHFSKDTAYILPYGEKIAQQGDQLRKQSDIPFFSPVSVYHDMKTNRASLRYIGEDENTVTLSYISSFYKQVSVLVNKQKYDITAVQFLKYSDIDGDYILKYNFNGYKTQFGYHLPTSLLVTEWDIPLLEVEYSDTKMILAQEQNSWNGYSLKELDKNLYLITLPTKQHQSFVVDYGDYIGIIEIPINEVYAKQIADFTAQNFPDKPIKYAFLTHHHPDHAGGFAYFYKNGADVVTTPISQKYQKELLERKHLLRDEELTYSKEGQFVTIPSLTKKDFSNKNIEMIAYEMGENSHTKEFILYYFPQSKILVVGDLFYTSEKGPTPSIRAKDIANFIDKEKLEVERFYQTWGWNAKEYSTTEDLRKSVEMYDQRNK